TRCMQKNPAQRFATMDELVNVLVQIYRGVVGPGMSTYMEAFPVMPSSAHQVQPTPPPMTRPVGIGNASAPTIAAPSGSGPALMQPQLGPPSGVYPGASTAIPRRSKAGVIIAVLAVLAVGGGVAAFVVVNNKGPKGPSDGSGSGSQVVIVEPGSGRGSTQVGHDASDGSGSATISHDGSGSGAGPGSDVGSNRAGSDGGSAHEGSNVEPGHGSDGGSNTPPPVEVIPVLLFARNGVVFEVYEGGKKVLDGPDALEVPK